MKQTIQQHVLQNTYPHLEHMTIQSTTSEFPRDENENKF